MTDPLGHPTTTTYDAANNKTSVTQADGHGIQYTWYDEMNRLKRQVDERNYPRSMGYDYAGNLRKQVDERGKAYIYEYDLLNRKTKMTYPGGKHEDWLYDWAGNLLNYTNRSGAIQAFTNDERNRQTYFTWTTGSWAATSWQQTDYDDASRVKQITNDISTITYTYRNDNRLETEEEWTNLSGNIHRTVTYTYDDDGNRLTVVYPGGNSFTYGYTDRSQPRSITASGQGNPIVNYSYDGNGNITGIGRDNGVSTAQTPDAANRVTSITHNLASGQKSFGVRL